MDASFSERLSRACTETIANVKRVLLFGLAISTCSAVLLATMRDDGKLKRVLLFGLAISTCSAVLLATMSERLSRAYSETMAHAKRVLLFGLAITAVLLATMRAAKLELHLAAAKLEDRSTPHLAYAIEGGVTTAHYCVMYWSARVILASQKGINNLAVFYTRLWSGLVFLFCCMMVVLVLLFNTGLDVAAYGLHAVVGFSFAFMGPLHLSLCALLDYLDSSRGKRRIARIKREGKNVTRQYVVLYLKLAAPSTFIITMCLAVFVILTTLTSFVAQSTVLLVNLAIKTMGEALLKMVLEKMKLSCHAAWACLVVYEIMVGSQTRLIVSSYRSLKLTVLGAAAVSLGNICARATFVYVLRRRAAALPPRRHWAFRATQHLLLQSLPPRSSKSKKAIKAVAELAQESMVLIFDSQTDMIVENISIFTAAALQLSFGGNPVFKVTALPERSAIYMQAAVQWVVEITADVISTGALLWLGLPLLRFWDKFRLDHLMLALSVAGVNIFLILISANGLVQSPWQT
ncbi:hypothetical protein JKP88DRAFT_277355 [Tribonema minus]|uniref:Uncharacterized protein n=1 Tax=Tribonema minus TaxID=303371 RepID=A0A836CHS3_9STRA|nr:hypothetical protein JKP88DRAFT_277355 [Tribonema minus]